VFGPFARKDDLTRAEEMRQREMTHAERMKAIELGQPTPEVELARAQTEATKARADAAKAIVGVLARVVAVLGTLGIAVAATAVVLVKVPPDRQVATLALVWAAVTFIGVATTLVGVLDTRLKLRGLLPERPSQSATLDDEKLYTAIQK
jgi:hypothetical protein